MRYLAIGEDMANEFFEIVDGYIFRTSEGAAQARKELEGIRYIKQQIDMKRPQAVLQVYNQILKEELFHTMVGYSFLRELQEYLKCSPEIEDEFIRALEVKAFLGSEAGGKNQAETERLKQKLSTSFIANVILVAMVVIMMVLMHFSDNATILNYKNKIIDQYEHWEMELEEREKAIKEREEELGIQP